MKKKSAKKVLKKKATAVPKKEKLQVINLKVTSAERTKLLKKAKVHTEGNLSAFLRTAGLSYV